MVVDVEFPEQTNRRRTETTTDDETDKLTDKDTNQDINKDADMQGCGGEQDGSGKSSCPVTPEPRLESSAESFVPAHSPTVMIRRMSSVELMEHQETDPSFFVSNEASGLAEGEDYVLRPPPTDMTLTAVGEVSDGSDADGSPRVLRADMNDSVFVSAPVSQAVRSDRPFSLFPPPPAGLSWFRRQAHRNGVAPADVIEGMEFCDVPPTATVGCVSMARPVEEALEGSEAGSSPFDPRAVHRPSAPTPGRMGNGEGDSSFTDPGRMFGGRYVGVLGADEEGVEAGRFVEEALEASEAGSSPFVPRAVHRSCAPTPESMGNREAVCSDSSSDSVSSGYSDLW